MAVLVVEWGVASARSLLVRNDGVEIVGDKMKLVSKSGEYSENDPDRLAEAIIIFAGNLVHRYYNSASFNEGIEAVAILAPWHQYMVTDSNFTAKSKVFKRGHSSDGTVSVRLKKDIENGIVSVGDGDTVTEPGTFLFAKMTDNAAESRLMANVSGFYNAKTGEWDDSKVREAGILPENLPKLCDFGYSSPLNRNTARIFGVKEGIPVFPAEPDTCYGLIGEHELKPGTMAIFAGSGGTIRMCVDKEHENTEGGLFHTEIDGLGITGMDTSGATECVDWFVKEMCGDVYKLNILDLMAAGDIDDNTEPPVFLPFLFGEWAPHIDENRKAGFCKVSGLDTIGSMYRAVLEGVCFNIRQCYDIISAKFGKPKKVILSGGFTHSTIWSLILAATLGCEVEMSSVRNASLTGIAKRVIGKLGINNGNFTAPQRKIIAPEPEKVVQYQGLYERYIKEYENN